MLDLARVDGFEWDDGNGRKSQAKHGVSQPEAEQVFFNRPLFVSEDERHSRDERRFHALGQTDAARRLHVSFTLRQDGKRLRVISARDMNRKERAFYEQGISE
jgi:uncharacterized DUF497 family protein